MGCFKVINRLVKISLISLVFLAGCATAEDITAFDLIKRYGCSACKPEECSVAGKPCGKAYVCCKEFVPEEHRYILGCKYDPLLD